MDQEFFGYPSELFGAIFVIVVVSLFLERVLAVLFEWRIFTTSFKGRGVEIPVALLLAFVVVFQFDFDAVRIVFHSPENTTLGIIVTAGVIAGASMAWHRLFTRKPEVDALREDRLRIQDRVSEKEKPNVLDTIQLNLSQLTEYYTINKSQARKSFAFSVATVLIGFLTIVVGIWYFYFSQEQPKLELAILSGLSGTLVEFIGAACFYIYKRSVQQMNFFFSQLVKMQDTMLSVRLSEQLSPPEKENELRERIILSLIDRSSELANSAGRGLSFDEISNSQEEAKNDPMDPTSGR